MIGHHITQSVIGDPGAEVRLCVFNRNDTVVGGLSDDAGEGTRKMTLKRYSKLIVQEIARLKQVHVTFRGDHIGEEENLNPCFNALRLKYIRLDAPRNTIGDNLNPGLIIEEVKLIPQPYT